MVYLMYAIQILICLGLILLVTTSSKDEGGLGSAIGGGGGGSRGRFKPGYEQQMDNITRYFAIGFFVGSLLVARFTG